ncbi:lysozyme [Campylobacter sp. faydin G-140]|uniref:glycoside hydrolase family protein n=1 Tax=Campylobacter anatolicus TaxID=2829105 RepID=UPI001B9BB882|nr:lysozyme [Campylobacter anatolicus]MBR8466338.1 lysozyme [Campylobacter anatolicus]
MNTLKEKIRRNEGFKSYVYEDTRGFATIGYGFKLTSLSKDELALNGGKTEPMSREVAERILDIKLTNLYNEVFTTFSWLHDKPKNVQEVVIEMCYQMGVGAVKKFATTLHHIRCGEYKSAYESGLKSLWAKQTPNRAKRVLSGLFK